jgi:hypothetical protein
MFNYYKVMLLAVTLGIIISCSESFPEQHWQKGNLHTHSLWSDGDDFPEMIINWYKVRNYQFIALSDHNTIANEEYWYRLRERELENQTLEKYQSQFGDWVETRSDTDGTYVRLKTYDEYRSKLEDPESFLIIRSEEVTSSYDRKPVHINVTNIQEKIEPVVGNSVLDVMQQTLDAVHTQRTTLNIPMFAHINHPNFGYGISANDLKQLNGERFFEVYNGHPAVHNEGNGTHMGMEEMWDLVNVSYYRDGKPLLLGIATDDSHNYHKNSTQMSNPGRGWVMVNSKSLTRSNLIDALEAGKFYASSGVVLNHVYHTQNKMLIEIDPKPGVNYEIVFYGYHENGDHVIELKRVQGTEAYYAFQKNDLFVRAKIHSTQKMANPYREGETEQAWTQPVVVNN